MTVLETDAKSFCDITDLIIMPPSCFSIEACYYQTPLVIYEWFSDPHVQKEARKYLLYHEFLPTVSTLESLLLFVKSPHRVTLNTSTKLLKTSFTFIFKIAKIVRVYLLL